MPDNFTISEGHRRDILADHHERGRWLRGPAGRGGRGRHDLRHGAPSIGLLGVEHTPLDDPVIVVSVVARRAGYMPDIWDAGLAAAPPIIAPKEERPVNRLRRSSATPVLRSGPRQLQAVSIGALAVGAAAVGAAAVGALAIGRLAIGRAVIRRLKIEELEVQRLHVRELQVDEQPAAVQG
jgi:hypothetical protein